MMQCAPATIRIAKGTPTSRAVITNNQRSLGPAIIRLNHASQISSTLEVDAANVSSCRRKYLIKAMANMNSTN